MKTGTKGLFTRISRLLLILAAFLSPKAALAGDLANAIVVKVNGDALRKDDFEKLMSQLAVSRNILNESHPELTVEEKEKLANDAMRILVRNRLIVQEASKEKPEIKISKDKIESYMRDYRIEPTPDNEEQTKIDMMFDQIMARTYPQFEPSPGEMRDIYNQNKDLFSVPRMVQARRITIPKMGGSITRDLDLAKAQRIRESAKENFAATAKQNCQNDEDRKRGGMVVPPGSEKFNGFFPPDNSKIKAMNLLPDESLAALIKLPAKTISEVIEYKGGFDILYIEEDQPARQISFKDAKTYIERFLRNRDRITMQRKWLVEIIRRSDITWHTDVRIKADDVIPPLPTFDISDMLKGRK